MAQPVFVPASALLHGDAEARLAEVLDAGLAALCAEAVGALDKLLAATVEYARNRKPFGSTDLHLEQYAAQLA